MKNRNGHVAPSLLLAVASVAGCTGDEEPVPTTPTEVTPVATEGFQRPLDAVASPDGSTFYLGKLRLSPELPTQLTLDGVAIAGARAPKQGESWAVSRNDKPRRRAVAHR
jgi:hypothetical protein